MIRSATVSLPRSWLPGIGVLLALALSLPEGAFGKGPTPPSTTPPPPPEEEPFDCTSPSPARDFDGDQLDDETECRGMDPLDPGRLQAGVPVDAFALGTCCTGGVCSGVPDRTGSCLDPRLKDVVIEFAPVQFASFTRFGVDKQVDVIGEIEADLAVNLHELPAGALSRCAQAGDDRCVSRAPSGVLEQPHWLRVSEDDVTVVSCPLPRSLPPYGQTVVSNPHEFGNAIVNTGVIRSHIECLYGSASAAAADVKRQLRFTTVHEISHTFRQAHFPAGTGCYLDATTLYTIKGDRVTFTIPMDHCLATIESVRSGETAAGATHCGDFTTLDGDGTEACPLP
jgi:hypothetical protein